MPKDFARHRRVEEQIQRILSERLRAEAGDPRLRGAVITAVRVSRDISVADVYFSGLDESQDLDSTEKALHRAAGFLRSRLAAELDIRAVPELRFRRDDLLDRGRALDSLIDEVMEREKQLGEAVDDEAPAPASPNPQRGSA